MVNAEVLRQNQLNIFNEVSSSRVTKEVPSILENRWMVTGVFTRVTAHFTAKVAVEIMTSEEATEGTTMVAGDMTAKLTAEVPIKWATGGPTRGATGVTMKAATRVAFKVTTVVILIIEVAAEVITRMAGEAAIKAATERTVKAAKVTSGKEATGEFGRTLVKAVLGMVTKAAIKVASTTEASVADREKDTEDVEAEEHGLPVAVVLLPENCSLKQVQVNQEMTLLAFVSFGLNFVLLCNLQYYLFSFFRSFLSIFFYCNFDLH